MNNFENLVQDQKMFSIISRSEHYRAANIILENAIARIQDEFPEPTNANTVHVLRQIIREAHLAIEEIEKKHQDGKYAEDAQQHTALQLTVQILQDKLDEWIVV